MPLLDGRELIFEWAPPQCFVPPIHTLNEVDVDVDDIINDNDIAEGNDFDNIRYVKSSRPGQQKD